MRDILEATGARGLVREARVQSLWSGYGELFRARLAGVEPERVIVKLVEPPTERRHPRGWHSSFGHARKLRSYDVEIAFYERYAARCGPTARVARALAAGRDGERWWLVLEDLDLAGFSARRNDLAPHEVQACLRWLAAFHAAFLHEAPEGLWPVGTYWHLDTRPEELAATDDPDLVRAAPVLDRRLSAARFQTFVHGDAKVANFCFTPSGRQVAAVDFQYVGGGCGMKDVAYFLSSLSDVDAIEANAEGHLETYFTALRAALAERGADVDPDALEAEWRDLYPLAWADFYRFLAGWSPGHWKIHDYSRRMTHQALAALGLA